MEHGNDPCGYDIRTGNEKMRSLSKQCRELPGKECKGFFFRSTKTCTGALEKDNIARPTIS